MVSSYLFMFHLGSIVLLTAISIVGSLIPIIVKEGSSWKFSLTNMFVAGLFFGLGISTDHTSEDEMYYFVRNVIISSTFAVMLLSQHFMTVKRSTESTKYARLNNEVPDGIEMVGDEDNEDARSTDLPEVPSSVGLHVTILIFAFAYSSFMDAMIFSQQEHTGYGLLVNLIIKKFVLALCLGAATASDSAMSKNLPRYSWIFFLSSTFGILSGLLFHFEISDMLTKYTEAVVSGICLYISTFHLLPEELRVQERTDVKTCLFATGFIIMLLTEYYLY
jgi:hypothetical protein